MTVVASIIDSCCITDLPSFVHTDCSGYKNCYLRATALESTTTVVRLT